MALNAECDTGTPTLVDGESAPLRLDAAGNLKVTVKGSDAIGSAPAGSPVYVAGIDNGGDLRGLYLGTSGAMIIGGEGTSNTVSIMALTTDGVTNNAFGLRTAAVGLNWNGATYDRGVGDTNGQVVQPALSSTFWRYAAASGGIVNTTTAVTIKTAGGAGVRNYVSSLQVAHDTLGGATELAIRDGAGGTVLWRGRLQTTASDSGLSTIVFNPPLRGTANTLLEVVTLTAVTGGVYVNAQGYTGS